MRLEQQEQNRMKVKKKYKPKRYQFACLPLNGPVFHCSVVLEMNIGTELVASLYMHEHLFLSFVSV